MIRPRYVAVLTVAALAGCQQVLGITPGTLIDGTGASGGASPGSSTASGMAGAASSSTGGASATSSSGSSSASSGSSSTGTGATGSSSSGTGGSTHSVCDNNVSVLTASEGFVDDFETPTRFPGWYSFADTGASMFNMIARKMGGAVGTLWAANTSGTAVMTPTAGGFGAGFGFNMKNASGQCAGILAFDGISFWAKGTADPDNGLTFEAVLPETQSVADGGDCVSDCFNHPSKTVTLSTGWAQYAIKWTDLTPGSDAMGPVTVDGIVLGFNWITPGPDFNVWIDEVTLYAGTPPTGPVGNCIVDDDCDGG